MPRNGLRPIERDLQGARVAPLLVMLKMFRFEFKTWSFFRAGMMLHILSIFTGVATYFFLGMIVQRRPELLYGGNYLSFLVVGYVLETFLRTSLGSYYNSVQGAYWSAKMERILLSATPLHYYMLSKTAFYFAIGMISAGAYLVSGILLGARLTVSLGSAVIFAGVLPLCIVSASGLGLISASMFVLLEAKMGSEPTSWVVNTVAGLSAGLYFPIALLPGWLQACSALLPHSYAYDVARRLFLEDSPVATLPLHKVISGGYLWVDVLGLMATSFIYLALGIEAFRIGLASARRHGTLSRWV